ncbi:hypothetical protein GCM10007973_31420 [Polymorphobacter multimanifer]|uniref:MmcB family DNA repair protein n=1 Tax=Polymorphobacter multimanifer TaxID=1070431 RepID=A0A841L3Y2_9SPHN|nr:MmcB family DNA repair protein [Polymorphobacter multimanifer]MBB6227367.1 hypothetical protein [Polymorphobacter multimanifer]GGI92851.1 hypothetical protein GCM10007973_31420 [Polymorphobacter multimanifer]
MESGDVRRGVFRWLVRAGVMPLAEVSLGCGRRADVLGADTAGRLTLVEIKVSLADLRGDRKWPDYLDWCDRFFWAVPEPLAAAVVGEAFAPERTGVLVADRYDAALIRDAPWLPLSAARRKAETLRFARAAACRLAVASDPEMMAFADA